MKMQAESAKLQLTLSDNISSELDDVVVIGDGFKLTQVIQILISNAIKFSPSNSSVDIKGKCII